MSMNGLFLKSDDMAQDHQIIDINLAFDQCEFRFTGEVIHHNKVDAIGFGVKFEHTKESKKAARSIVQNLESHGMRISVQEIRPEDSFISWVRTLFTTGKGLLPKEINRELTQRILTGFILTLRQEFYH